MSKLAQACELSLNEWLGTIPDELPEVNVDKNFLPEKNISFNIYDDENNLIKTLMMICILSFKKRLTSLQQRNQKMEILYMFQRKTFIRWYCIYLIR